jgi:peptide/nickel transport system permease protein
VADSKSRWGAPQLFNYIVRRTLQAIPLLLLISVILYFILDKAPGGPLAPYLQNPHIGGRYRAAQA